ncbi:MAG: DUF2628 domain-containing protein [Clostridia bacterium]|nr:DUF2628 domain-containing protein [Clostridia bacterium]
MSLDIKGQKCAVCSAYLFEEDDVVYCPTCGAPHHRECYASLGHCGLEDKHGTPEQYKKPDPEQEETKPLEESVVPPAVRTCRGCGKVMDEDSRFCPYCGLAGEGMPPFFAGNPYGPRTVEIKDDTEVAQGVTALEAAKTVVVNAIRYVPKFLTLSEDKKLSWNWAAFLMPHAWFAYRKMYKSAVISGMFMLMSQLLTLPMAVAVAQLPTTGEQASNYMELMAYYSENLPFIGAVPVVLALIGLALNLVVRIICGSMGDWLYRDRVIWAVKTMRDSEEGEEATRRLSGISLWGFTIAFFSVTILYDIIAIFLM